ncbi:PadR family transcriptional regulator [Amycolatopsis sp. H20-H5]|uniref:PadR family transcriptional regulator n=1 Tax=Amycolatopsis sp. H20-H5 TaxID=3046309 RepID=UPI002DB9B19D|nr:PadR family transcriptional regulator [Amycolatopsis sp. H20-H5]MEC3977286.1 PadR family transcriptional regulator [Amycolatopsis sp. H20-H5]
MTTRSARRSPLAMTVLLLLDRQPLHPYGLRRLILRWHKDRVVNVSQRNAIYQVIERLERSDLISVKETARDEHRPERTVYEVTEAGERTARRWLLEMLGTPAKEYPEFPAALSFLDCVPPEARLAALEQRQSALREEIVRLDADLTAAVASAHLVEIDYLRTMCQAELAWLEASLTDLKNDGTAT